MEKLKGGLLIAGGGTGGHVLAGVAVADGWKKQMPDAPIRFIGAKGGIEEKLIPRAGYSLDLLALGSLNQVSFWRKIKTLLQLPVALWRSACLIIQYKPEAILGVGGYASGPLLLMASLLRVIGLSHSTSAIIEQNSVPGFTNRILGRFVKKVFCAFPGTENQFPKAQVILTGNPIRSSMKRLPSAPRSPFTLFVFGGSQGAGGINSMVLDALPLLKDLQPHLRWVHQTGEKDYDRVAQGYAQQGVSARIERFIHDMPEVYAQASLLICRAGSSTLSEIAAVGRASILIPFPFASDNHQQKNAEIFVHAGAADLLLQGKATGKDLTERIRKYFHTPELLTQMENAVTIFYRPQAVDLILKTLQPPFLTKDFPHA